MVCLIFFAMVKLGLGSAQHEGAGAARGDHRCADLFTQRQIAGIGRQSFIRSYVLHM